MATKHPTDAEWRTVIELTVKGYGMVEVARALDTSIAVIYRWIDNDPTRRAQITYARDHVPEHIRYRRLLRAAFPESVPEGLRPPVPPTCMYRHIDGTFCGRRCQLGRDRCLYHQLIALPRPERQMCRVVDADGNACPYVATTNRWKRVLPDDPEFGDCLLAPQLCDRHYDAAGRDSRWMDEELARLDSSASTRATCSDCGQDFTRAGGDRSRTCPLCERGAVEGPRPQPGHR